MTAIRLSVVLVSLLLLTPSARAQLRGRVTTEVNDLMFSGDGGWLIATYCTVSDDHVGSRGPSNTTFRNLNTGDAYTLHNVGKLCAASADGKWVAMNHVTRVGRDESKVYLAVWKIGEVLPVRTFDAIGTPATVAFDPASKHVAWINSDVLWLAAIPTAAVQTPDDPPHRLAELPLKFDANQRPNDYRDYYQLAFGAEGALKLTLGPALSPDYKAQQLNWQVDFEKGTAESRDKTEGKVPQSIDQKGGRSFQVVSPDGKLSAIAQGGKITVVKGDDTIWSTVVGQ